MDLNAHRPDRVQTGSDGPPGQLRTIAVAAEMAEIDASQIPFGQLDRHLRRGFVRQVAVTAQDPLLRTPGTPGILLEQPQVVIGLQDQPAGGPDAFQDESRHVPQVGKETQFPCRGCEDETHGIHGIVGNAEGPNFHLAQCKRAPRFKKSERETCLGKLVLDSLPGQPVRIDRDPQFPCQHTQSLYVVAVLMGD